MWYICLIISILPFIWSKAKAEDDPKAKPHIVFFLADDFGYSDAGFRKQSAMETPCIDELAEQGITLENYYVQPICTPSRSQLMSGRYQIHTGLQHKTIHAKQPSGLPLDNLILPQQLGSCGYSTYMVGKWHLGFYKSEYLPQNRGFDKFFGLYTGWSDHYTHSCNHGIDLHSENGAEGEYSGIYSTHLYTNKAREFIENHNTSKPMFLYLAHQAIHEPNQVPRAYEDRYLHIQNKKRRTRAGMVSALDESVCNVTKYLKKAGMWENTIFVFSNDNGGLGGSNWPLRGMKHTLFEGGVRGVGIINGGFLKNKKANNTNLFHVSDWLPSLMGAVQCPVLANTLTLDGVDQWDALMDDNAPPPRNEILHNIDPLTRSKSIEDIQDGFDVNVRAAIRKGPWKLITGDPLGDWGRGDWIAPPEFRTLTTIKSTWKGPYELYNIELDPTEKNDVSGKNSEVVSDLLQLLSEYEKTAVPVNYPHEQSGASPNLHGGFWVPWKDK